MIPLFGKAHRMQLTETEKSILDYFEKNLPLSVHTHLNDLSSALYTSNATIVRFCQKLGLNGYNEFKYQLRHELKQMKEPVFSPNDLISHSLALFREYGSCRCRQIKTHCRLSYRRQSRIYLWFQFKLCPGKISSGRFKYIGSPIDSYRMAPPSGWTDP